jgi:anti-sigma regulatory factor (Ser/Thr protein kinase)
MTPPVVVVLEPTPSAVRLARACVDRLHGQLTERQLDDARLLVSELVTNSLRHAALTPDQSIELTLEVDAEVLRAEVRDPGEGFVHEPRAPDPEGATGWGLFLVSRLASSWGVQRDGSTRVWFELPIGSTATSTDH